MFFQASVIAVQRAAATVTTATNVLLGLGASSGRLAQPDSDTLWLRFTTAGRTAGSVVCSLQGSLDGTTWYSITSGTTTLNANGIRYVNFDNLGAVPPYMRTVLTPTSFDGTVEVAICGNLGPMS